MEKRSNTPEAGQITMGVPRFRNGRWEQIDDNVTEEVSLRLIWADESGVVSGSKKLWAWPHALEVLALGHVLLDVVPSTHSLHCEATATLEGETTCRVLLGDARGHEPLPPPPASWRATSLLGGMHDFISAGGHWDGTGCFHRAGVFDVFSDRLLTRAEDIGRHNCLDRLAGWSAMTGTPLTDKVLMTTARITASLCAKALRAGFRFLVSRSAVTTASVEMAREHGATLAGFARTGEARFTVFADEAGRLQP